MASFEDTMEANIESLECARYGESEELIELFDKYGADCNYVDPETGNTALHRAAANGECECIKILIKYGSKHIQNLQGNYPIHWAAQNGKTEALKLLFDNYVDVDVLARNSFGLSTLSEAFNSKDADCIEVCLTHSSASEEKLIPKGCTESETTGDGSGSSGCSSDNKNAVLHFMTFSNLLQQSVGDDGSSSSDNSTVLRIRELPITRADDPFGTDTRPEDDTTGLGIWPASIILARYAIAKRQLLQDKVVVELGAGCGLPGIAAAMYAKARTVYLTDIHQPTLDNSVYNASLNADSDKVNTLDAAAIDIIGTNSSNYKDEGVSKIATSLVRIANVSWNDTTTFPPDLADVVLGSDLVYDDKIIEILIPAISSMLAPNGCFLYVAPDTGRAGMDKFHEALLASGYRCVDSVPCPPE